MFHEKSTAREKSSAVTQSYASKIKLTLKRHWSPPAKSAQIRRPPGAARCQPWLSQEIMPGGCGEKKESLHVCHIIVIGHGRCAI